MDPLLLLELAAITLLAAAVYGAPSIVAVYRHHRNAAAIRTLNVLLGWTVVGWVAALVWALYRGPEAR